MGPEAAIIAEIKTDGKFKASDLCRSLSGLSSVTALRNSNACTKNHNA